jgi:Spy/CpxP family protein refolding chaperone
MPLDHSTTARLTAAMVLILVLGAGVVLGVALDRKLEGRVTPGEDLSRQTRRPGPDSRGRGFDPGGKPAHDRRPTMIVDQVGLSAEQNEKVDSIVQYYGSQMRDLHDEFDEAYMTRFREIMSITREEIKAVLTPEQTVAYDSLTADWERRRQERRLDSVSGQGESR